jgi:hypothetical protein
MVSTLELCIKQTENALLSTPRSPFAAVMSTSWSRVHDAIVLLAVSLIIEVSVLSKVELIPPFPLAREAYHAQHLALMSANVVSLYARGGPYAHWIAFGAASTLIGDYVNSAVSAVEPCSTKLTWALLLFGIGYSAYVFALWRSVCDIKIRVGFSQAAIAVVVLVINVYGWTIHLSDKLTPFPLLYYGSLVFDLTLYVAMLSLGVWFAAEARFSAPALAVLVASVLIPFSDLILFASWFSGRTDPRTPTTDQYAQNWLLYFSGQVLFGLLPLAVATVLGGPQPAATQPATKRR